MARKPRIHYPGAVYHVIARGNNQEYLLSSDTDKQRYLDLIRKYKERFQFNLYGYVIMDNHVHLLLEVNDHALAKIMQGIQQSYTQWYNRLYGRVGHVFQQRYKAIECVKDEFLLALLKYIHYNPVRAGISSTPQYSWSSHDAYLKGLDSIVNTEFCLEILDSHMEVAIQRYLEFMDQSDQLDKRKLNLTNSERLPSIEKKLSQNVHVKGKVSLEDIVCMVTQKFNISKDNIIVRSRNRKVVMVRNIIIYLTLKHDIAIREDLASELNLSASQISRGYYAAIENEDSLAIVTELENTAITQA